MTNRGRGRPSRRRGFDDDFAFDRAPPGDMPRAAPSWPSSAGFGPEHDATVKWFNPEKGFGFVALSDGSGDAFLHANTLNQSGHNAVSPGTVMQIDAVVRESGATFVDGGIIGPPPDADSSKTRIYLSGPDAAKVMVLQDFGLSTPLQPGPIGAASAMKMSYAGITKGFTALGATMMLAATRAGTADALLAEMQVSQPALLKWLTTQMPKMPSKAYRWVAEMDEIAAFVGAEQAGDGFYQSASRLYQRIAADHEGPNAETAALNAFCDKAR